MDVRSFHRASHYRQALIENPTARLAFIQDPRGELEKHAGIVMTDEENEAVVGYINISQKLEEILKGGGTGPYDPTPTDTAKKAPRWLHALLDAIWDYFTKD